MMKWIEVIKKIKDMRKNWDLIVDIVEKNKIENIDIIGECIEKKIEEFKIMVNKGRRELKIGW